jgi:hypothetical protein
VKIEFPSREFDEAVAAVCHGTASEDQSKALNELLRNQSAALDEYIIRVELHSRLASDPDLFASATAKAEPIIPLPRKQKFWPLALAAALALIAAGLWMVRQFRPAERSVTTSRAVAMLNRTADAQWNARAEIPKLGAPLEPGLLRLEVGLAEIIFYSGARLVIEGPTELRLTSQNDAFCRRGRIVAEVPDQARGFRIETPQTTLTNVGTSFAIDVTDRGAEVHAFKGTIRFGGGAPGKFQTLSEGSGVVIETGQETRRIAARPDSFAALFDLDARSAAADARRHDQWRTACKRLDRDPSLLVHFDFESVAPSSWQLRNVGKSLFEVPDGTMVGCQWTEGRWPEKRALEFQSVSDRVRLTVPGEFQALTLTAWVSVKGLDRKINSLLMSDGFDAGTVHWMIRRDGALGMTVIGAGNHQIVASPPVVTLDKFGTWIHLAVTLDGAEKRVTHYINGLPVDDKALKIAPPFRIGAAELGNWNAKGFPENDPFMIRNFSGAMDDFCIFARALSEQEIRALYSQGKPQPEPVAQKPK